MVTFGHFHFVKLLSLCTRHTICVVSVSILLSQYRLRIQVRTNSTLKISEDCSSPIKTNQVISLMLDLNNFQSPQIFEKRKQSDICIMISEKLKIENFLKPNTTLDFPLLYFHFILAQYINSILAQIKQCHSLTKPKHKLNDASIAILVDIYDYLLQCILEQHNHKSP